MLAFFVRSWLPADVFWSVNLVYRTDWAKNVWLFIFRTFFPADKLKRKKNFNKRVIQVLDLLVSQQLTCTVSSTGERSVSSEATFSRNKTIKHHKAEWAAASEDHRIIFSVCIKLLHFCMSPSRGRGVTLRPDFKYATPASRNDNRSKLLPL